MIISIKYYDYKMLIYFQDKILYILVTLILILHRKLYRNIVSIIVLNITLRQYNIKINLAVSCSSIVSVDDELRFLRLNAWSLFQWHRNELSIKTIISEIFDVS